MKKFHLSLLFSLAVLTVSSQKVYFVYIQTESAQPFFVKMNKKIINSTASGYIILSKLVDSTYNFNIGFPQNKWMEQQFSITLGRQDHGYLLKNFDDKGWGLFDLQSLAVQMSISGNTGSGDKVENKNEPTFTDILAKAADDPSLKEKPVQPKVEEKKPVVIVPELTKKDEPKVEEKKPVVIVPELIKKEEPKVEEKKPVVIVPELTKKDEPKVEEKKPVVIVPELIKKEEPKVEEKKPAVKEEPVTPKEETNTITSEPYKRSQVKKWSESSTTEGSGLVFIDSYENGMNDTIRLVIPNPKPVINVIKEEPKVEKKFLEINTETTKKEDLPAVKEEKIAEIIPDIKALPVEKTGVKNNCSDMASESDFFKLRKKMAGEEKEDNMIAEAKKYFKIKCFSTAQLKNLSTLFLTEEGKYNFLDAAYKYVTDPEVFGSLQAELKDQYYNSRFKAMLRN